jgi:hypothetical protein
MSTRLFPALTLWQFHFDSDCLILTSCPWHCWLFDHYFPLILTHCHLYFNFDILTSNSSVLYFTFDNTLTTILTFNLRLFWIQNFDFKFGSLTSILTHQLWLRHFHIDFHYFLTFRIWPIDFHTLTLVLTLWYRIEYFDTWPSTMTYFSKNVLLLLLGIRFWRFRLDTY